MGCDVHPVIQVKEYSYWSTVAIPDRTRCYRLFGFLAGVRDPDIKPICLPRGLPEDARYSTASDKHPFENLSFEHTPTWFTLKEAEAADDRQLMKEGEEWPWIQWQRWLSTARFFAALLGKTEDEVRFVMDFDS